MPDSSESALSGLHDLRTFVARFGFDHTPEGAEGEWAGGPSPPPPCGQLTRCFSAVAELLVNILSRPV